MSKVPTVKCPKDGKEVSVYCCMGSVPKKIEKCSNLITAIIDRRRKRIIINCKLQKKERCG